MHEIDLTNGAVLETHCVYVVQLLVKRCGLGKGIGDIAAFLTATDTNPTRLIERTTSQ